MSTRRMLCCPSYHTTFPRSTPSRSIITLSIVLLALFLPAIAESAEGVVRTDATIVARVVAERNLNQRNSKDDTTDTLPAEATATPTSKEGSRRRRKSRTPTTTDTNTAPPSEETEAPESTTASSSPDSEEETTTTSDISSDRTVPIVIIPTLSIPPAHSATETPTSATDTSKSLQDTTASHRSPLNAGVIAGVIVAALLLVLSIPICCIIVRRRRGHSNPFTTFHSLPRSDLNYIDPNSDTRRLTFDRETATINDSFKSTLSELSPPSTPHTPIMPEMTKITVTPPTLTPLSHSSPSSPTLLLPPQPAASPTTATAKFQFSIRNVAASIEASFSSSGSSSAAPISTISTRPHGSNSLRGHNTGSSGSHRSRVRKPKKKRPEPPLPEILTGPNLHLLLVPYGTERSTTGSSSGTPVSALSGGSCCGEKGEDEYTFLDVKEDLLPDGRRGGRSGGAGGKGVRELMEVFVPPGCGGGEGGGTEDPFADPQSPVGSERWRFGHGYYPSGTGSLASLESDGSCGAPAITVRGGTASPKSLSVASVASGPVLDTEGQDVPRDDGTKVEGNENDAVANGRVLTRVERLIMSYQTRGSDARKSSGGRSDASAGSGGGGVGAGNKERDRDRGSGRSVPVSWSTGSERSLSRFLD
ncbi:hypothetical protein HDV00_007360 [Rhizophlyctis rosea]|nr:hypothetical protein HDV00_007360 [Rhizophlyctis rosea]